MNFFTRSAKDNVPVHKYTSSDLRDLYDNNLQGHWDIFHDT